MGKKEIKCPHCKQWTEWEGGLYDRCQNCHELLEQEKINKMISLRERKQAEEAIERLRIENQNPFLRKITDYTTTIFISFILTVIAIVVLMAG
ncbi:hypothetical protein H7F33_06155 [Pedobacter sp. PAMC26386]|nr:hypothetical protein H7F33_06155 [Pedobacter sp. PAMC26386]